MVILNKLVVVVVVVLECCLIESSQHFKNPSGCLDNSNRQNLGLNSALPLKDSDTA